MSCVGEAALALVGSHGILLHLSAIVSRVKDLIIVFVLDKQVHDLAGAGPYHGKSCVSDGPFYRVYIGITDSSHDLHRVVYDVPCSLSGKALGFTDETPRVRIVVIHRTCCAIG